MSKSKRNTIDPEKINNYGADAVRLFILSDSPQKEMFNGQMKVYQLRINLYISFGILI